MSAARRPATSPTCLGVALTVADIARSTSFYRNVLGFADRNGKLALGDFILDLRPSRAGRPMPDDSRSHDRWFRHVAIVVRDMAEAHRRLVAVGVETISSAPQTLPTWNKQSAGIEAFYFRDPDRHPLELIHFPAGKGKPIWHQPGDTLFQGVDHTAIVVARTSRSLRYYCDDLGFEAEGFAYNHGAQQEALSGVGGAFVRVTTLAGAGSCGLELLEYESPHDGRAMPAETTPHDHWWATTLLASASGRNDVPAPRDPDGHGVEWQ